MVFNVLYFISVRSLRPMQAFHQARITGKASGTPHLRLLENASQRCPWGRRWPKALGICGSNHPDSAVRQTIGAFDIKKPGAELGNVDEAMTIKPTETASAISEKHWQASGTLRGSPSTCWSPVRVLTAFLASAILDSRHRYIVLYQGTSVFAQRDSDFK